MVILRLPFPPVRLLVAPVDPTSSFDSSDPSTSTLASAWPAGSDDLVSK